MACESFFVPAGRQTGENLSGERLFAALSRRESRHNSLKREAALSFLRKSLENA
jgi:hypothetical protein